RLRGGRRTPGTGPPALHRPCATNPGRIFSAPRTCGFLRRGFASWLSIRDTCSRAECDKHAEGAGCLRRNALRFVPREVVESLPDPIAIQQSASAYQFAAAPTAWAGATPAELPVATVTAQNHP